jgi:hypothetical protein
MCLEHAMIQDPERLLEGSEAEPEEAPEEPTPDPDPREPASLPG